MKLCLLGFKGHVEALHASYNIYVMALDCISVIFT